MANKIIDRIIHGPAESPEDSVAGLGGNRAQSFHRLQIGLSGIAGIILLVALADSLSNQADQTDAVAVPEAVAPAQPNATPSIQSDPLAGAGVVPDLPADNAEAAAQNQPVLPEQGSAVPVGNGGNAPQN